MFKHLDERVRVAGQIEPGDVSLAAADGVVMIINNRPDDESPGQPSGAEIEAAARAVSLVYRAIPVTNAGFSSNQVDAMQAALAEADGPVLAFCRSGTRSTLLWALAEARSGANADALSEKAAAAGYDLTPIRAFLS